MKKLIVGYGMGVLLAFAAGVAAERFLFAVSAETAETEAEGSDAPHVRRTSRAAGAVDEAGADEEDSEGVTAAEEGEGDFVEAVPAESVKVDDESDEATVEEVRDEEDGLTDEERAEKFRRENPEEWERIQKRRRAMMAAIRKAAADNQDFLEAIEDAYLTEEQRKEHAAFADALATRNATRDRVRAAVGAGKDPSSDDFRALTGAERTLREKAEGERKLLLEATARSLGLEKDDVKVFVGILDSIDSCTRDLR